MLRKRILFFLVVFAAAIKALAAEDTAAFKRSAHTNHSHLRLSLITGGPGLDIFETFGHSCIRVVDSDSTGWNSDLIYNYGFYDEFTSSYLSQWLNGRVRSFLETTTFDQLKFQFDDEKRKLTEQELLLNDEQKELVVGFLKKNRGSVNRYYEYDTFYDNCTTRLRDMFTTLFGAAFVPGNALPPDSHIKFRDFSSNMYCPLQHKYWFGIVLNLFYASRADRVMSNKDAMFNPDYFARIMAGATLDGKKMCADPVVLYPDRTVWTTTLDEPMVVSILIALITIGTFLFVEKPVIAKLISIVLMLATGLLGCYMLNLWLRDCEPAWKENYNILWALPTNVIVPFFSKRIKRVYAVVALGLLGVAFLVHIFRIQEFPLMEVGFLWLALIWIYATMYRRSVNKA